MSEETVMRVRRPRRGAAAIKQLVREFVDSGLRQNEFCRSRGIALNTLKRYLKRHGEPGNASCDFSGLVAVELAAVNPARRQAGESGLAVVVGASRRIEVDAGFDAPTLARLIAVLERL
jgi:hypothetical protein